MRRDLGGQNGPCIRWVLIPTREGAILTAKSSQPRTCRDMSDVQYNKMTQLGQHQSVPLSRVLDRGTDWRHLANTTEESVCGSNAAYVKWLWPFVYFISPFKRTDARSWSVQAGGVSQGRQISLTTRQLSQAHRDVASIDVVAAIFRVVKRNQLHARMIDCSTFTSTTANSQHATQTQLSFYTHIIAISVATADW